MPFSLRMGKSSPTVKNFFFFVMRKTPISNIRDNYPFYFWGILFDSTSLSAFVMIELLSILFLSTFLSFALSLIGFLGRVNKEPIFWGNALKPLSILLAKKV